MRPESAAGRPRKLAVLGAYGGVNIGDEMILRAVVRGARACGYEGEIDVLGPDLPPRSSLAADYAPFGLRFVSWRNPRAALSAVAGRDLLIGGGQVIDGAAGAKGPLMQSALAITARLTGGRVLIGGVSTERLASARVRRAYALLFRCAQRIVTRDERSLDDILAIAPSARAKTEACADFVFGMKELFEGGAPVEKRTVLAYAPHRSPTVGHSDFAASAAFLRRMLGLLRPGQRLAILAHDNRADFDLGLARELGAELDDPRVDVIDFANVDECIAFYREVRSVLAARMHPIILAACADAFCVPLQGSRKVRDIAGRLAVPHAAVDELMQLSDAAFADATGISDDGPRPDPAAVAGLRASAGEILQREV